MSISIQPRPPSVPEIAAKAIIGPGAGVLQTEYSLGMASSLFGQQNQTRKIRKAWELGVSVPWIRAAERAITGPFSTVGWHLEDGADEDIDDAYPDPQAQRARALIEKPQANVPVGRKLTRRELWALTGRHMGLCGVSFWFLDQREAYADTPAALLYIRPDRMTPDEDASGNLTGWFLDLQDQDRPTIRLNLNEVVQFTLDPPDTGHYGIGLVESALLKAANSGALDRHLYQVVEAGGRLAGLISPKQGDSLNDTQYQQLIADARAVAEASDSAKRLQVLRGPVDFTQTVMSVQDMQMVSLLNSYRDDLLALWGVPLSQIGGSAPAGFGGEVREAEYKVLITNAVHPRWVSFQEAVQFQLLDRWQKLGTTIELEIEEPEFEDRGLYEVVAKTATVPLRNRERRELIGREPFGTPQDDEVWLPITSVLAFTAPLDDIHAGPEIGQAPAEIPAAVSTPAASAAGETVAGKASIHRGHKGLRSSLVRLRTTLGARAEPKIKDSVAQVLQDQKAEIVHRVRDRAAHLLKNPGDARAIWDKSKWDKRMRDAIQGTTQAVAEQVDTHLRSVLEVPAQKAGGPGSGAAIDRVLRKGGERITGMNETTLAGVLDVVRPILGDAIRDGLSPAATADQLEMALDDAAVFDELRAETIARTELMFAYNDAAIATYGDLGVSQVEAIDGDQDEECADRNGQIFSLDDAELIEDHPNGTLDWMPVMPEGTA